VMTGPGHTHDGLSCIGKAAQLCKFEDQPSSLCGNRGFPSRTKNTSRSGIGIYPNSPCRGSGLGFHPREALDEALGEALGEALDEALGEVLGCLLHHLLP